MIYVCPVCNEATFSAEDKMRRHYLSCWKIRNPSYRSKSAPRDEQVVFYNMNNDLSDFFNSFLKENN